MSAPEDDGRGRYSSDPDVAVLQFKADEQRERLEADGVDYEEIMRGDSARPIAVRRAR